MLNGRTAGGPVRQRCAGARGRAAAAREPCRGKSLGLCTRHRRPGGQTGGGGGGARSERPPPGGRPPRAQMPPDGRPPAPAVAAAVGVLVSLLGGPVPAILRTVRSGLVSTV